MNAVPVGSRYLSKKYKIPLSPATIRNVMLDLEEKGLLQQPHTSAGRVPTDKGYRQYVNSLSDFSNPNTEEINVIINKLSSYFEDIGQLLESASQVLSDISNLLGVVLAPRFYQGIFQKLELVPITDNRLLVILTVKSGLVKTILMELKSDLAPSLLEDTTRILNERLFGCSLQEIETTFIERFSDLDSNAVLLINVLAQSRNRIFKFEDIGSIHYAGTKNIVNNPEFSDTDALRKILELVENREIIIKVLTEKGGHSGVSISIGEEHKEELLKNCSLITAQYDFTGRRGTVGVIGPTRMQYEKVIALVDFMSRTLGYMLGEKVHA